MPKPFALYPSELQVADWQNHSWLGRLGFGQGCELSGGHHSAGWGGSHTASVFSLLEATFLRCEGGLVVPDDFYMSVFIYSTCEGGLKINLFLFSTFLTLSFVLHTTNKEKVLGKHKAFQSDYFTIVFYFIYKTRSVHCLLVLFPDLVHKLLCLVLCFLPVCLQFFACSYEKEC